MFIRVQPTAGLLTDFARWAVAQRPKVRTVSTNAFAVPSALFVDMPEHLLIGATVDGHAYVPVADIEPDTAASEKRKPLPQPATGGVVSELPPVAETVPALTGPRPPQPDGTSTAGSDTKKTAPFSCPDSSCGREFTTARGRDLHARQAHPETGE